MRTVSDSGFIHLRLNGNNHPELATESVIGLIDRQRQDQERMLKALAAGSIFHWTLLLEIE